MTDEKFVYTSDLRDKKITARSARNKRTHNGKGGAVKFPSDFMTKKELNAMNGQVESYKLNSPMTWKEFKKLPDDLKVDYIKLIRSKYNAFDSAIAEMMGINKVALSHEIKRLGLGYGTKHGGYRKWEERQAFWDWVNGTDKPEEVEEVKCALDDSSDFAEVCEAAPVCDHTEAAIPGAGCLSFEGSADKALKTVSALLGGANVRIHISWELCENG